MPTSLSPSSSLDMLSSTSPPSTRWASDSLSDDDEIVWSLSSSAMLSSSSPVPLSPLSDAADYVLVPRIDASAPTPTPMPSATAAAAAAAADLADWEASLSSSTSSDDARVIKEEMAALALGATAADLPHTVSKSTNNCRADTAGVNGVAMPVPVSPPLAARAPPAAAPAASPPTTRLKKKKAKKKAAAAVARSSSSPPSSAGSSTSSSSTSSSRPRSSGHFRSGSESESAAGAAAAASSSSPPSVTKKKSDNNVSSSSSSSSAVITPKEELKKRSNRKKSASGSPPAHPAPVQAPPSTVLPPTAGAGAGAANVKDGEGEKKVPSSTISTGYHEAHKFMSSYLAHPPPPSNNGSALLVLQALILELGCLPSAAAAGKFSIPELPGTMRQAKLLLKSRAFINVRDYLAVREQGQAALQRVMHPSRKSLVREVRKGKRVPVQEVKKAGLNVLLVNTHF